MEVTRTMNVLYAYLSLLSVKVSKPTVRNLLNTPVGDSIRGISDALDELHIDNEVYQLPADLLEKLNTPFIAALHSPKFPFCVVEKIEEGQIGIIGDSFTHHRIPKTVFLKKWTGAALVGEVTEQTVSERMYRLHNLLDWVNQRRVILGICILALYTLIGISVNHFSSFFFIHVVLLWLGVAVSAAIIYKESYNKDFLKRFCSIGKVVDCNRVLNSSGSKFFGIMKLGELSLLFFATLLCYTLAFKDIYYAISFWGVAIAFVFTVYSVFYQAFVVKKWCMLCMCINLLIWGDVTMLYLIRNNVYYFFDIWSVFSFCTITILLFIAWLIIKQLLNDNKEKRLLKEKIAYLYEPKIFNALLYAEKKCEHLDRSYLFHNSLVSTGKEFSIVISLNCVLCAELYRQLIQVAEITPVSLLLLINEKDEIAVKIAKKISTCYIYEGWDKAKLLIKDWFENKDISQFEMYDISDEGVDMYKRQQDYCKINEFAYVPIVFVDTHYLPIFYDPKYIKCLL